MRQEIEQIKSQYEGLPAFAVSVILITRVIEGQAGKDDSWKHRNSAGLRMMAQVCGQY